MSYNRKEDAYFEGMLTDRNCDQNKNCCMGLRANELKWATGNNAL